MKRKQIAVIIPRTAGHCRDMIRGIYGHAYVVHDWQLHVSDTLREPFTGDRYDGVIFLGGSSGRERLRQLAVPVVNLSNSLVMPEFPTVNSDDRMAGRLAAEYFLSRGYRHFAFADLRGPLYARRRKEGFTTALAAAGYACSSHYVYESDIRDYRESTRRWLRELPKPLALFACSDAEAHMVRDALQETDLRVPADVAIMGVDNDDLVCMISHPPLSSIKLDGIRIGRTAAALLDDLSAGDSPPPREILVPPLGIEERGSTQWTAIEDELVRTCIALIGEQAKTGASVAWIAAQLPLNRRSLEIRFKAATGLTMHHLLQRERLKEACRLLESSGLHLGEVARRSGFHSQARFCQVFRKHFHITPTDWRQAHARNR